LLQIQELRKEGNKKHPILIRGRKEKKQGEGKKIDVQGDVQFL
jgi:hypothetical protein